MAYNGHTTYPGVAIGPYGTTITKIKRYRLDLAATVGTVNAQTISDVTVTNTDIKPGDKVWSVTFATEPTAALGIGGFWTPLAGGSFTLRVFNATAGNATAVAFVVNVLTLSTVDSAGFTQLPALQISQGLATNARVTPITKLFLTTETVSLTATSTSLFRTITKVVTGSDINDILLGAFPDENGLPTGLALTDFSNNLAGAGADLNFVTPTAGGSSLTSRIFYFLMASTA